MQPHDYKRVVGVHRPADGYTRITFWDGDEESTVTIRDADARKIVSELNMWGVK